MIISGENTNEFRCLSKYECNWWRGPVIQLLGGHELWVVIGG
jgi:hypothetical protein